MSFQVEIAQLVGLILASLRIGTWMILAPPFSYGAFPLQVRFMVAVALALVMSPDVPPELTGQGSLEAAVITYAVQEMLIGALLGFICMVVHLVVQAAGNIIDMLGGFMMAFAFDQQLGGGVSPMGRAYHLTALALLFATNAHLLILRGLLETFTLIPVGQMFSISGSMTLVMEAVGRFIMIALQIAGPLMGVLFLADVGLGLLVRIAPQLNVLMLMFPLKIGITLILVAYSFASLPQVIRELTEFCLSIMARFAQLG